MEFESHHSESPQPTGLRYLFMTWTGRIIVINTIVYLAMGFKGGWFTPDTELLLRFGAKDSVSLAQGDYWRFFTPVFVHIGLLHYVVNNLGLYYIGFPLERLLGWRWFLAVYLIAGVVGNVSSALFNVSMSAGASGALFGLLGCGFYFERVIGQRIAESTGTKPRTGVYSSMVIVNIMFGILVPGIDNAAHLGGLLGGILTTYTMTFMRPNQLREFNPVIARRIMIVSAIVLAAAMGVATSPRFVLYRLGSQAEKSLKAFDSGRNQQRYGSEAYSYFTEALKIDPDNLEFLYQRGRLLFLSGKTNEALNEFRLPAGNAEYHQKLIILAQQLRDRGMVTWQLERLLTHTQPE